jgi:hypothetical protein
VILGVGEAARDIGVGVFNNEAIAPCSMFLKS